MDLTWRNSCLARDMKSTVLYCAARSKTRNAHFPGWRVSSRDLNLHVGSIESYPSLHAVFEQVNPDECYHLAASSFVSYSFDDEFSVFNTNINGTHNVLSALKNASPGVQVLFCRFI